MKLAPSAYCFLVVLLACVASTAYTQQVSGSISGVVHDAQGAVVPGAKITLINQDQGTVAQVMSTTAEGTFVFTPLQPATYTIVIESSGFKKYSRKDIVLFANDRLGLPPIALEVGSAEERITVTADAAQLETVTATRAGVVTDTQVRDLALNGRQFSGLYATVPGITNDGSNAIAGQRTDQYTYTLDGVTMEDSGCGCFAFRYSVDAIAEVKIQTNALTAEFGHSAGPQVTVVSKSGARDFHGSGFWFHRNEGMNANTFTNNVAGIPRPIYRYTTAGWNLGGPFYITGKLNRNRDKVFFFAQQEWNHSLSPAALKQITVPAAAERNGDFSASHNAAGVIQTIKDPANNGAPFPGNIIPQSRWNTFGKAILDFLPAPNWSGATNFNWISQVPTIAPQLDEVYRADYNISESVRFTFRLIRSHSTVFNPYSALASNNLYGAATSSPTGAWGVNANFTNIISPTLTNEFVYGNTRNYLPVDPPASGSKYLRSVSTGLAIPLLYPGADPAGMIPNLAFGGVPSATGLLGSTIGNATAYSQFYGLPYANENPTINFTDNVTKIAGTHIFKAGVFFETATKLQSPYADVPGSLIFDQDSQNPGDTGWAFSNALLGNYRAFTQMSKYEVANYKYSQLEWYLQDTWKVRPSLTLNYGIRFSVMRPLYETGNLVSSFVPSAFDPKRAVTLYQPNLVNGARSALNPFTGATLPSAFIGAIVPGSGDINNGMLQQGSNGEPKGLLDSRGPQYGPRFGFAWTPGGPTGKTVIRSGIGVFYERIQGNYMYYQITNPPVLRESQLWYGGISNIVSAQQTYFPVYAGGVSRDGHLPTVYNYNFGVQRQLPMQVLMDVSYVGSLSRHQTLLVPFNDAPFGSAWLPQNQDPTKPTNLNGDNALPVAFYRPYVGYNGPAGSAQGVLYTFGGTANYNALQASFNRRMSRTFQVGVAYTWSKALGVQSSTTTNEPIPNNIRQGMYGPLSFDRTQTLTLNYLYNLPDFARKGSFLDHRVARIALNGWQFSGITSITGGAPVNVTYNVSSGGSTISGAQLNRRITGSEDVSPRPVFTCDPMANAGGMMAFVNASCFAPAPKGSVGIDSGWDRLRGPGYNNWNMSLFKKIQYTNSEGRYIQLRLEVFNAPNHTEWNTFVTSATLNDAGQIINTPTALGGNGGRYGFGALNTVRTNSQRIIQIAAKIYF